jgi:hypothetical protein
MTAKEEKQVIRAAQTINIVSVIWQCAIGLTLLLWGGGWILHWLGLIK